VDPRLSVLEEPRSTARPDIPRYYKLWMTPAPSEPEITTCIGATN